MQDPKQPTNNALRQQLYNPIAFIEPSEYKRLRKQKIKQALTILVIGLVILIAGPILYAHGLLPNGEAPRDNNSGLVFLGFGLPILGIYLLMTVKRRVEANLRTDLVWLHPQLKQIEMERRQTHKNSKVPLIVVLSLIISLLAVGLFFYIKSL